MKLNLISLSLLVLFFACDNKDPEPNGEYDQGIFVLNEGNFGTGNGSLSFINRDDSVIQNVFAMENNGLGLGDVAQSMTETDDLILIVVNNSNVLYALDKKDLTIAYSIETLNLPRYATHKGDYGYVTEWVSFSEAGRLTQFELATGEIITSVTLGFGAEFPTFINDEIYVTNNFESSISIVDPISMSILSTLQTEPSPGQIITTENSNHWVICAGGFDANFAPANNGAIQKIENGAITRTIAISQNISGKAASKDDNIYIFSGQTVWEVVPHLPQINEYLSDDEVIGFYGIGFEEDGQLLMTDNKGFQSPGQLIKYDNGGIRSATFTLGIGPNTILLR